MLETPRFIQGVYWFTGAGFEHPIALKPEVTYTVPFDKRAQLIYLRAGNSSGEMVYLVLTRGSRPMRYFAIGAKNAVHVPLAIVEDIDPETKLELRIGAPEGLNGAVLLDMGLVEI